MSMSMLTVDGWKKVKCLTQKRHDTTKASEIQAIPGSWALIELINRQDRPPPEGKRLEHQIDQQIKIVIGRSLFKPGVKKPQQTTDNRQLNYSSDLSRDRDRDLDLLPTHPIQLIPSVLPPTNLATTDVILVIEAITAHHELSYPSASSSPKLSLTYGLRSSLLLSCCKCDRRESVCDQFHAPAKINFRLILAAICSLHALFIV